MKKTNDILQQLEKKFQEEERIFPIHRLGLLTTGGEDGQKTIYNRCTENIFRILQNCPEFKGKFRYNEWTQKKEILKGSRWVEISDSDYTPIQRRISTMYKPFRQVGKEMVIDAIHDACTENPHDEALNYLRSLTWDKNPRLDVWLSIVYGVEFDEYHQAVGTNFFKGMVKRILEPGCKFDTVMILEGKQGCGKSTSFSIIAGPWHLETTTRADDKDFLLQLRGKLIVEFSEGETMSRTETKNMKAMISTAVDTYRAPYGREMMNIPRRCVFAMTTNQDEYLKDETGNRRFYPVEVVKDMIDLEWLRKNRDQLFAEALYRVEVLKESVHEYPQESTSRQEAKMEASPYEDEISSWLKNPRKPDGNLVDLNEGFIISDVWKYALSGEKARLDKRNQMMIASALRHLGYEKVLRRIDGIPTKIWIKKATTVTTL